MPLLSMNELSTYRWTFEQDVARYRQAGYGAIGVWRQKLSDYGEELGIDLLAEHGLQVTNLLWAGGFTGSDGRSFDDALQDALHAVRTAAALQARCLVVYPGGRNNHIERHVERLLCTALDELLDLAEACDVTLALEPMHPACAQQWTFLTDLEATLELLQSYDTPRLKLVLDAYHFCRDAVSRGALQELAPWTAVVHLADRRGPHDAEQSRHPLGAGQLPLKELIRTLTDVGYAGDYDVELYGAEILPDQYDEVLRGALDFFEQASPTPSATTLRG